MSTFCVTNLVVGAEGAAVSTERDLLPTRASTLGLGMCFLSGTLGVLAPGGWCGHSMRLLLLTHLSVFHLGSLSALTCFSVAHIKALVSLHVQAHARGGGWCKEKPVDPPVHVLPRLAPRRLATVTH